MYKFSDMYKMRHIQWLYSLQSKTIYWSLIKIVDIYPEIFAFFSYIIIKNVNIKNGVVFYNISLPLWLF